MGDVIAEVVTSNAYSKFYAELKDLETKATRGIVLGEILDDISKGPCRDYDDEEYMYDDYYDDMDDKNYFDAAKDEEHILKNRNRYDKEI